MTEPRYKRWSRGRTVTYVAVCLLVALGYDLLLLWLMPDGSESLSLLLWLIFVFRISRVIAEAFEPRKETE